MLLAAQTELLTPVLQVVQRAVMRHLPGAAELETPWRDGTTHRVMSPLEFMQRLAGLVPRPRVVPKASDQASQSLESAATAECETEAARVRPGRICWARLLEPVPATTSLEYVGALNSG